jgi:hypothetical protein
LGYGVLGDNVMVSDRFCSFHFSVLLRCSNQVLKIVFV